MKKLAVVVPSIRPEAFTRWLERWKDTLWPGNFNDGSVDVIVVWDMENEPSLREMSIQRYSLPLIQLSWADIKPEWKAVVHCKSDSVRNLGFLVAATLGYEYIGTLDDDVFPVDNLWVDRMLLNLQREVDPITFYPAPFKTRGHPSKPLLRPVKLHHGLWEGIPDVYAEDQVGYSPLDGRTSEARTVPYGQLMPTCGMNLAFHRDLLPAMYFWPQVPYRRYGDIWMGLIAKKVIDICGWAMTSGSPSVFHTRLSDVASNIKFETEGKEVNDYFWGKISEISFDNECVSFNPAKAVKELVRLLPSYIFAETRGQLTKWVDIVDGIKS